jgi:hypothetical protein
MTRALGITSVTLLALGALAVVLVTVLGPGALPGGRTLQYVGEAAFFIGGAVGVAWGLAEFARRRAEARG